MGEVRTVSYEPELGQAVFGQPWQQYEVKGVLDSALSSLADAWHVVRPSEENPFTNSGAQFDGELVRVHAYSWSDDEQPWNLLWRDVRISWYKHCGRGATVNRRVTDKEAKELFVDCMRDMLKAREQ
jgi:hypothetical protein